MRQVNYKYKMPYARACDHHRINTFVNALSMPQ